MNQEKTDSPTPANPATSSRSSSIIVFIVLMALFIGARLWRLTSSCLWFDEIFSIHAASYGWSQLLRFIAADIIHPPLFYVLLKMWTAIGGESLLWLRLFPVLISIAVVVPFLLFCRELNLRAGEINFALLLIAVNGYLIKYAQEVRMYSLLLFFSVTSFWLFVRFMKASSGARKQLVVLSAVNLLLVYTHYYGWLVLSAEAVILLFRRRDKLLDFSISVVVLLLAFSPWVYAVVSQSEAGNVGQNIGWVARPRPGDIAQFITLLNEPFYFRQSSNEPLFYRWSAFAGLFLLVLPLLVLLWRTFKQRQHSGESDAVKFNLIFFLTPLVLAFLLSWFLPHSIWGTRHLIVIAVPYSILAAMALIHLRPMWIKTTVLLLLGCWLFIAASAFLLRREASYIWCAWEQLGHQMAQERETVATTVSVYAFEDLVAYHLWFALRHKDAGKFRVGVIKGVPGVQEDPAYFLPRGFDDVVTIHYQRLKEGELWVAFRDLSWAESRPPMSILIERGYQIQEVLETRAGGQRAFLVRLSRK